MKTDIVFVYFFSWDEITMNVPEQNCYFAFEFACRSKGERSCGFKNRVVRSLPCK